MSKGCDMAALIDEKSVDRVDKRVREAVENGAELLAGGNRMPHLGPNFFEPTVLLGVTAEDDVWRMENFGPVVAIRTFGGGIEEAFDLANDSDAGLCNYFYSADEGERKMAAERLQSGMLGINCGVISNAASPFGGINASGIGREGGWEGYESYLEEKYICEKDN